MRPGGAGEFREASFDMFLCAVLAEGLRRIAQRFAETDMLPCKMGDKFCGDLRAAARGLSASPSATEMVYLKLECSTIS